MTLEIFGSHSDRTKEYAVNLGIALQLTNILRDVGLMQNTDVSIFRLKI